MSDDTPTCLGRTACLPGRVRGWMVRLFVCWIPQSTPLAAACLFTDSCGILFLLSSHGFSQTEPKTQAETRPRPKTTGSPICNLPMLWPVRSCRSHARASRAAARPGTTSYGARLGPVPVRPARLQHQRSSQALLLGTRSLGTLLPGCVSTIELYAVPRPIEQSDGQPAWERASGIVGNKVFPVIYDLDLRISARVVFSSGPRESNEAVNRDQ